MITAKFIFIPVAVAFLLCFGITYATDRPVIGVLAADVTDAVLLNSGYTSSITASYVKLMEMGGARVVPLPLSASIKQHRRWFQQINGLFIPGGPGTPGGKDIIGISTVAKMYIEWAIDSFGNNGDYFPIWGTCLGMELILYTLNGNSEPDLFYDCNVNNVLLSIQPIVDYDKTRLFGKMPKELRETLESKPITPNYHSNCVSPDRLQTGPMRAWAQAIAISKYNGDVFVAAVEARHYPFYAVQFHPEKNVFEWQKQLNLSRGADARAVAQYFANFFVDQTKQNHHKFESEAELRKQLIYNFDPIYTGNGTLHLSTNVEQMYLFKSNGRNTGPSQAIEATKVAAILVVALLITNF